MSSSSVHLVFISIGSDSHLLTTIELAKLILNQPTTHQHLTVTIIVLTVPSIRNPQLTTSISNIRFLNLTILELQPITAPPLIINGTDILETPLSTLIDLYKPSVKAALQSRVAISPVTALVIDFLCGNMIDLAHELGIPPYVFFTSSAAVLGFLLHAPTAIDPLIPVGKTAMEMTGETVPFPGFSTRLPLTSLPESFTFRKDDPRYQTFIELGIRLLGAEGFLVNTFHELQQGPVEALEEGLYAPAGQRMPHVYNVGPILSLKVQTSKHHCVAWLDTQPRGSVVFLCFGSMGVFPKAQVREMAVGLERSGHRFLWVVRTPPEKGSVTLKEAELDDLLPEGFVERTKERGLVWPSFVPQGAILGHVAVGGFVTHCGWNSCLESVWFSVPMAAWPLYAEQHLNAYGMVVEMGVAVEVRIERERGNWVDGEEVERTVRLLMGEGSAKMRERVRELKEKGRRAVGVGGSSYCSLTKLMDRLSNELMSMT